MNPGRRAAPLAAAVAQARQAIGAASAATPPPAPGAAADLAVDRLRAFAAAAERG